MRLALTAGTALLLAACGGDGGGSANNTAGDDTAAADVSLQPGQWEMASRMNEIEAPGMPEAMLAQMRSQMGDQAQSQSECMTAEEAANPAASIVNAGAGDSGCQFTDSTFTGGNINVHGTCDGPNGPGSMQMSLEGTYTATSMDARITTEMQAPEGMPEGVESIRVSGTLTGHRTGECTAG